MTAMERRMEKGLHALFGLPRRMASRIVRRWLANASGDYGAMMGRVDQVFRARRDLLRIAVQDGLVIDVFWKSLPIGRGPALSVFVCGEEFARFDCFGPDRGHFHLALFTPASVREHRLKFGERTATDQISRAIFEIDRNLAYYLERAANPAIRTFEVHRENLLAALPNAESKMREFLLEQPELRDLR
jgi:hypothetical protein